MPTVLDLRRTDDPRVSVHRTVEALAKGHVVGVPTETVYGLAADALNPEAVQRLAEIKGRPPASPLVLSVRGPEAILDYMCDWSPLARRLASRCMPGPLTLVVPCSGEASVASRLHPEVRRWVLGEQGCIAFRVVDHPVISQLHQYLRGPLVLTSANRSGDPPPTRGDEIITQFGDALPLVLDDGPTRYGGASTVVRVIGHHYEILRHGAIEATAMNDFAKPLIVLVCTGNTCRSPMAEALLRKRLEQAGGRWQHVNVLSAGVAASDGSQASPHAVDVLDSQGIDLSCHASRPLSDAIMQRADVVLTMTRGHRAAILAAWPEMADRVHTLRHDGGDIADPVGGPAELYQQCADQIAAELDHWLGQLDDSFLPIEISASDAIDKAATASHDQPLRGDLPHTDQRGHQDGGDSDDQEIA